VPWAYLGATAMMAAAVSVPAAGRAVAMARRPALEVLKDL
jgi:hypothetical protein